MLSLGLWLLISGIILVAFMAFVWQRTTRRSRFQARLTLLFLLFILIPVISLTILMSYLLLQSSRMLEQPGMSEVLQQSLQAVHAQLDQMGASLLKQHPDLCSKNPQELRQMGVHHAGAFRAGQNKAPGQTWSSADGKAPRFSLLPEEMEIRPHQGIWVPQADPPLYEYYEKNEAGVTFAVAFIVPPNLVQSRQALERALNSYATFALLRESVIDQGLIWLVALVLILMLSLAAVFVARQFSDEISQPIRALAEAMRRVGSGELEARVTVKARDEVAFLISSFHSMADALISSREKLQRAERAAAWRDAARQVSHEIKNPLTPIQLSLHRLKRQLSPQQIQQEDIRESLRIIEEEVASIGRIAGTFSEFARMPALELLLAAPAQVVQEAMELVRAEHPQAQLALSADPDLPDIPLDREQLRRALHNLLKNGIEASGSPARLEIELRKESGQGILCRIRDHGCGMDDKTLQRLQRPYFTTKKEGTGLGLTIARRIILEHGGEFRMESEVNIGTTVEIHLRG